MAFWNRKDREPRIPEVHVPGQATVLEVGSSVDQRSQQAVRLRLRLQVALEDGRRYEVTTAWQLDTGMLTKVQEGAVLEVDVVDGSLEQVHPRDGRASWDRTRTPQDPKVRMLGT